eukprot:2353756-Rhodomonas_salina.2
MLNTAKSSLFGASAVAQTHGARFWILTLIWKAKNKKGAREYLAISSSKEPSKCIFPKGCVPLRLARAGR